MAETNLRAKQMADECRLQAHVCREVGAEGTAEVLGAAANELDARSAALAAVQQETKAECAKWMQHLPSCDAIAPWPLPIGQCSCGLSEHLKALNAAQ